MNSGVTPAPFDGLFGGSLRREQAGVSGYDSYVPVITGAMNGVWARFLGMSTRGRACLALCFLVCVGIVMLFPILLALKIDGDISASWAAIWTPLWVLDALGFLFFAFLVSWGNIPPPPGMEQGWKDPYPVSARLVELLRWTLLIVFQVLLVMRLDGDIQWPWSEVMSPIIAWACLRLVEHLHAVRRRSMPWGLSMCLIGAPVTLANCLVIIQLVFIAIRLDEEVTWSWWVVFIPTWIIYALQLLSGYFGRCASFALVGLEGTDQVAAEAQRLKDMQGVQFHRTSSHYSLPSVVSLVLAIIIIEGADMSAFVIFVPQLLIAGAMVCAACTWCLFWPELDTTKTESDFEA